MRTKWAIAACTIAAMACGSLPAHGQASHQDALLTGGGSAGPFSDFGSGTSQDAQQYADGAKAIHEARWADAVKIFESVAQQGGQYADGALYWKAYALNKLGQGNAAIDTCSTMKTSYPKSGWKDDCEALEIEIHASNGKPAPPKADQSDELKLLALASLMRKDPEKATAQIKEIVEGDASEQLKEGAVFILGQEVPDSTYAQIVRISYLEGDVRIARASENEKSDKPTWETAVMNLPLNTGDSIATGKDGRVEIEFENASTLYLAENSVLNCIDLHTTGGVPQTELALVSGTVTTHLNSLVGGETFLLRTPTENILTRYPQKQDLRVTSYLDGMAVTSLSGGLLDVTGSAKVDVSSGKTLFFSEGHPPTTARDAGKTEDFSAFDAWVADRYAARSTATAEMMKDSGLAKPIPGLADMQGKGHFFDCPPYGTCWQPDAPQAKAVLTAPEAPPPTPKTASPAAGGPTVGGLGVGGFGPGTAIPFSSDWFPCMWAWYPGASWGGHYPSGYGSGYYSGVPTGYWMNPSAFYLGIDPYSWALCHAGGWVPYGNSYAWVAGVKRYHRFPGHWVKFGKQTVLVPYNPKDVKGKTPLNRFGFQPVKGKDGTRLVAVKLEPGKPVAVLTSAPREFRNSSQVSLARADAPHMTAFALHENSKAGIQAHAAIPMTYNHEQGFVTSHTVMQGGRAVGVSMPVGHVSGGPVGGLGGALAAGHSGGNAFGASHAAGGFGASHAGGGFGGGAHAGGGGGGFSGGGGHVGGGGGAASGASAGSASSAASSGGGSHK